MRRALGARRMTIADALKSRACSCELTRPSNSTPLFGEPPARVLPQPQPAAGAVQAYTKLVFRARNARKLKLATQLY
ncbi:hypothetical protein EVAR_16982_1 [Eumeta japonica]|uniref:Uncharacterized protein n=1 Tax=Eumeta variegata TaxID=151549 RepID=A0A4C1TWK8_EUMVA|nr:hypothetical protein EVAR_16982_1 [Eumeta japonica]